MTFRLQSIAPSHTMRAPDIEMGNMPVSINSPAVALSASEQKRIEHAIRTALDRLPEQLRTEMAKIPPVNAEVARLASTNQHALEGDRKQAIGMLALHTVMEAVIDVRNRAWDRPSRETKSDAIDAFARDEILRQLRSDDSTEKLRASMAKLAAQPLEHYAVGVSERENHTLTRMVSTLTHHCRTEIPEDLRRCIGEIAALPAKDRAAAYTSFNGKMDEAFADLFAAYDEKVRKGSLIGVDHKEVNALADQLAFQNENPSQAAPLESNWLKERHRLFSEALRAATESLPKSFTPNQRNAWKIAYLAQFRLLNPANQPTGKEVPPWIDSGLNQHVSTAAALWRLRSTRREEAEKAPKQIITLKEGHELLDEAITSLKTVIEDNNGQTVTPRSGQPKSSKAGPSKQTAERHAEPLKEKGTFSDLRTAYETERSGVPWKNTLRQESMLKIAEWIMRKAPPSIRAGLLDALSTYGKQATEKLSKKRARLNAMPPSYLFVDDMGANAKNAEKVQRKSRETGGTTTAFVPAHRYRDPMHLMLGQTKNSFTTRSEMYTWLNPEVEKGVEATALHELAHLFQKESMEYHAPLIKKAADKARNEHAALTLYAEVNLAEFWAEALRAYFGVSNANYETHKRNMPGKGIDVYSPENLRRMDPDLYAYIDEYVRQRMSFDRANKSFEKTKK